MPSITHLVSEAYLFTLGHLATSNNIPELTREEISHLQVSYGLGLLEDSAFGLELSCQSLLTLGFERLCYRLLPPK
jgi:hypothetical protein